MSRAEGRARNAADAVATAQRETVAAQAACKASERDAGQDRTELEPHRRDLAAQIDELGERVQRAEEPVDAERAERQVVSERPTAELRARPAPPPH